MDVVVRNQRSEGHGMTNFRAAALEWRAGSPVPSPLVVSYLVDTLARVWDLGGEIVSGPDCIDGWDIAVVRSPDGEAFTVRSAARRALESA